MQSDFPPQENYETAILNIVSDVLLPVITILMISKKYIQMILEPQKKMIFYSPQLEFFMDD